MGLFYRNHRIKILPAAIVSLRNLYKYDKILVYLYLILFLVFKENNTNAGKVYFFHNLRIFYFYNRYLFPQTSFSCDIVNKYSFTSFYLHIK